MDIRSKAYRMCGIIFFVLTFLICIINIKDWSGITILAFLFMLWSEFIFFGGLDFIEKIAENSSQIIIRSGFGSTVGIYSFSSFFISLIFMLFFKHQFKIFITIQLTLLGIAAILSIVFIVIGKNVKDNDDSYLNARSEIEGYIDSLNELKIKYPNSEYAAIFGKLAEDLRFTDTSAIVNSDKEIASAISELQIELMKDSENQSKEKMDTICANLNSLIGKRKIEVNATKRGGI